MSMPKAEILHDANQSQSVQCVGEISFLQNTKEVVLNHFKIFES